MAKFRKISTEQLKQIPLTKAMQLTLASLRLENIILTPESIADLQLVDAGKLSQKNAIARVLARVPK